MRNVLLIAGLDEQYYFQPFVEACTDKEIAVHVCDPSRYPEHASFCIIQNENGDMRGHLDTIRLTGGSCEKMTLPLSEIHIAWYVRENYTSPNHHALDLESRFSHNETRQALRALFSVLSCTWINKSESIDLLNSNKLYQQMIAARCGLLVPKTIVSNSPSDVENFSDPHEGLLLKTIGYIRLDDAGECALYSERFSYSEIVDGATAIRSCPIYGQEYVAKRYEHRVMIIGRRVLSCRIDSQASSMTQVDWRHYDFGNVEHKWVSLPRVVEEKLLRFMNAVDLRYGAIDMIETPSGDFVFLEVNPSGQWGWIADIAGLPIANAVAEMLESL